MADYERDVEDMSGFWGPESGGPLEAAWLPPPALEVNPPPPAPSLGKTYGLRAVGSEPQDDVAKLAEAIAAHQIEAASRAEVHALRSDLEAAFNQQLAMALYELVAASNDRLAAVEERTEQRLHDVAQQINDAVSAEAQQLATSIELYQRSSMQRSNAVFLELSAVRQQLVRPVAEFTAFQREMRHEVGRLGDMVATEREKLAQLPDGGSEEPVIHAAPRETRAPDEAEAGELMATLGDVSARIVALQSDVAALHQAVSELRRAVESGDRRGRRRGRRSQAD